MVEIHYGYRCAGLFVLILLLSCVIPLTKIFNFPRTPLFPIYKIGIRTGPFPGNGGTALEYKQPPQR